MIKATLKYVYLFMLTVTFSGQALAEHAWGDYHWARTTPSFDLVVVNSTTFDWDPYVARAIDDWSTSVVLNLVQNPDGDTSKRTRRKCAPDDGQVRICNLAYGRNGWLGIAGITVDTNSHITTGYTKLNDTYFSMDFYNAPDWKQSVACQELGHDVGLSHQDEDFDNESLYSCMDYQVPPFEYPNEHDYEQLELIYGHTDSYDSYSDGDTGGGGSGGGGNGGCNAPPGKGCNKAGTGNGNVPSEWGMSLGRRGQKETFIRITPDGTRHITFVTWAKGH